MKFTVGMFLLFLVAVLLPNCGARSAVVADKKVIPVDTSLFFKESLTKEVQQEKCRLSDGTDTTCYKIVVKAEPKEHQMGPWCPERIDDAKEKGGMWFKDGKVYDVDGKFIADLDKFYADTKWKLYREDGTVKVTTTREACEAAARPNVDPKYHNYCVECAPSYYKSFEMTYLIPVTPLYKSRTTELGREGVGVAFNGVGFDPPAPLHAILDAHTLAPLDDCGGHVNPHKGYHYHAMTGCSKEVKQDDEHAPLLGYALDGFGIYALLNKAGQEPVGIDECGGHSDEKRGYHYHAGKPGNNKIINCFRGEPGTLRVTQ